MKDWSRSELDLWWRTKLIPLFLWRFSMANQFQQQSTQFFIAFISQSLIPQQKMNTLLCPRLKMSISHHYLFEACSDEADKGPLSIILEAKRPKMLLFGVDRLNWNNLQLIELFTTKVQQVDNDVDGHLIVDVQLEGKPIVAWAESELVQLIYLLDHLKIVFQLLQLLIVPTQMQQNFNRLKMLKLQLEVLAQGLDPQLDVNGPLWRRNLSSSAGSNEDSRQMGLTALDPAVDIPVYDEVQDIGTWGRRSLFDFISSDSDIIMIFKVVEWSHQILDCLLGLNHLFGIGGFINNLSFFYCLFGDLLIQIFKEPLLVPKSLLSSQGLVIYRIIFLIDALDSEIRLLEVSLQVLPTLLPQFS